MRQCSCPTKDLYEYVGLYEDDLISVISDPEQFLKDLQKNLFHAFNLKGSEEVKFHLICGFVPDSIVTLCMDAGRYVDKMRDNYSRLFLESLISRNQQSPQT